MGLDQYLTRKTYVKQWSHYDKDEIFTVSVKRGGKKFPFCKPDRMKYVEEEMIVWRKANAIHKWFVHNIQNDNDNCGTYNVTVDELKELLDIIKQVLAESKIEKGKVYAGTEYSNGETIHLYEDGDVITNPEVCKALLPCSEGFFFGSTEYDQYYLEDLTRTKEELESLLKEHDEAPNFVFEYYYSSSW